jgi:acetolactate synthase small subunit
MAWRCACCRRSILIIVVDEDGVVHELASQAWRLGPVLEVFARLDLERHSRRRRICVQQASCESNSTE